MVNCSTAPHMFLGASPADTEVLGGLTLHAEVVRAAGRAGGMPPERRPALRSTSRDD